MACDILIRPHIIGVCVAQNLDELLDSLQRLAASQLNERPEDQDEEAHAIVRDQRGVLRDLTDDPESWDISNDHDHDHDDDDLYSSGQASAQDATQLQSASLPPTSASHPSGTFRFSLSDRDALRRLVGDLARDGSFSREQLALLLDLLVARDPPLLGTTYSHCVRSLFRRIRSINWD